MQFNVHTPSGVYQVTADNPKQAAEAVKNKHGETIINKIKLAAGQKKPGKK
jgi:hypothetical protein